MSSNILYDKSNFPIELQICKHNPLTVEFNTICPAFLSQILIALLYLAEYEREPCLKAKAGTLHPHPDDCKKFIQCISLNRGQELTCAMNLVYDPDAKTCIYPKNDLICPDILPCLQKNNGYFAHPFNCSLYIQCESGREKIQTCSSGLIWVPSVNSCMYPTDSNSCKDKVVTWQTTSVWDVILSNHYYYIMITIILIPFCCYHIFVTYQKKATRMCICYLNYFWFMLFYYIPYRNDKIVDLNTVFYFTHKSQCFLMCVMKSIKKLLKQNKNNIFRMLKTSICTPIRYT